MCTWLDHLLQASSWGLAAPLRPHQGAALLAWPAAGRRWLSAPAGEQPPVKRSPEAKAAKIEVRARLSAQHPRPCRRPERLLNAASLCLAAWSGSEAGEGTAAAVRSSLPGRPDPPGDPWLQAGAETLTALALRPWTPYFAAHLLTDGRLRLGLLFAADEAVVEGAGGLGQDGQVGGGHGRPLDTGLER